MSHIILILQKKPYRNVTDILSSLSLLLLLLLSFNTNSLWKTTNAFVIPSANNISPVTSSSTLSPTLFLLHSTKSRNESSLYTSNNNNNNNKKKSIWRNDSNQKQTRNKYPKYCLRINKGKPQPSDLAKQWEHRQDYVQGMTTHFCNDYTEPGSLSHNGKWNQAYSMFCSWSKFATVAPKEAPIAMEKLFKRLLQEKQFQQNQKEQSINPEDVVKISTQEYNSLLYAWMTRATMLNDKQASQRAQVLLHTLQDKYVAGIGVAPDSKSFQLVFKTVCAVEEVTVARRLLGWMEYLYRTKKNVNAKPSLFHYNLLLDKYANSSEQANSGIATEGLIRQMRHANIVQPSTASYNIAIKAWDKSSQFFNKGEAAKNAERIMNEMQAPKDAMTYATVITAWSNSGMKKYAALRADELLEQMEQDPNVTPNKFVLSAIMTAWTRSECPMAVDRSMELLRYMEVESKNNDAIPAPDMMLYNTCLQCLSVYSKGCTENAQQADDLLARLEKMSENDEITFQPNVFSYYKVVSSWLAQASPPSPPANTNNNIENNNDNDFDSVESQEEKLELAVRKAHKVLIRLLSHGITPHLHFYDVLVSIVTKCSSPITTQAAAGDLARDVLKNMQVSYATSWKYQKEKKIQVLGYVSDIVEWAEKYNIPNITKHAASFME